MNSQRIYCLMVFLMFSVFIVQIPDISAEISPSTYSLNFDEGGHATPIGTTEYLSVTLTSIGANEVIEQIVIEYSSPPGFSIEPDPPDPIISYPYILVQDTSLIVTIAFTPQYDSFTMGRLLIQVAGDDPPNDIYIDLFGYAIATNEICTDGFDNDVDSYIDCDDADCVDDPFCGEDTDEDGIPDTLDNCPAEPNPDQDDFDGDGVGDECDNCPRDENPLDVDNNGDGIYDAQKDTDTDGIGDICDDDNDNDGCTDDIDPNPYVASVDDEFVCEVGGPCGNFGDGYGADCDNCPHEYNPDTQADDFDEDGVGDDCDNCPRAQNPFDVDTDSDGIFDAQKDTDGDGLGDACDTLADSDNDGCADDIDPNPYVASVDDEFVCEVGGPCGNFGDGYGADCDNCPHEYNPDTQADDADGDNVGDECDNCYSDWNPFDIDTNSDGIPDEQSDFDDDGIGDICDDDKDNDGCTADIDPDDFYPSSDEFDEDGIGSECDNCPYAYNPDQYDFDDDDKGNACDNCWNVINRSQADLDRDCPASWPWLTDPHCGNSCDNCPGEPNILQADTDNDGQGDACDCDDGIKGEYENGIDCGGPCPTCSPCALDELPPSFDWSDHFAFPDVRDQVSCGSCWAHSALGAMEMTHIVKHGSVIDDLVSNELGLPGPVEGLSEQALVSSCGSLGGYFVDYSCNGGWANGALEWIQMAGVPDDDCFRYQSGQCMWSEDTDGDGEGDGDPICCDSGAVADGTCTVNCDCGRECSEPCNCDDVCLDVMERIWTVSTFKKISNNIQEIKRALICQGPLSAGSSNWGHAITIVGYDNNLLVWYDTNENEQYDAGIDEWFRGAWIIRNSWGNDWEGSGQGEGYGAIPYENHPYSDMSERVYYVGGIGEYFLPIGSSKAFATGNVDGIGPDEMILADVDDDLLLIYNKDGVLMSQFSVIFDDGDKLAAGDVNSDGKDEIIHADVTNYIRVYTGDGTLLNEFITFFKDSDSLAVGDVTGDHEAEIIKGESPFGFRIYNRFGTLMFEKHLGDFSGSDRIATGNLRDSYPGDEIIMGDASANRIFIYDETDTLEAYLLDVIFGPGDNLASGNVDGYLEDEIIHATVGGRIQIIDIESKIKRGFEVNYLPGDALVSGDVTGDGKAEIIQKYIFSPLFRLPGVHIYRY